jgi:hypothetical protein
LTFSSRKRASRPQLLLVHHTENALRLVAHSNVTTFSTIISGVIAFSGAVAPMT